MSIQSLETVMHKGAKEKKEEVDSPNDINRLPIAPPPPPPPTTPPSTGQPMEKEAATPYTVFTRPEQRLITACMGMAMFFSPLTANIYFPLVPALQAAMAGAGAGAGSRASVQRINLTITAYVAVQGVSPLFLGDWADAVGRRPVYLVTFAVYSAASLGLGVNRRSYAALLALRMLQSAGCSATAAVSYGVLADVAPPAARGRMLAAAMVAANLGPSVGPLVGGLLAHRAGWPWVFWCLLLLGAAFWSLLFLVFPETARPLVGNGSAPVHGWNRAPLFRVIFVPRSHRAATSTPTPTTTTVVGDGSARAPDTQATRTLTLPNPCKALKILCYRDAALVLWMSAVYYMAYYCVQASIPNLFLDTYGFNDVQIGVSYLAIGIGVAAGGYTNGKFLDVNYRAVAKQVGFTIDKVAGDDLAAFPIERARTRFAFYFVTICTLLLVGYGWSLEHRLHVSVPLALQFLLGFITTCTVQTFNTLLVDIFPANPSTAAASGNITRCAMSAAGIAALQPLLNCLGRGWFFTLLGMVSGFTGVAATVGIRTRGMAWRKARAAR